MHYGKQPITSSATLACARSDASRGRHFAFELMQLQHLFYLVNSRFVLTTPQTVNVGAEEKRVKTFLIEAEFARLTSVDLKGCLFAGLDQHMTRFLELYRAKSGIEGLTRLLRSLDDNSLNHHKRTVLLLGLPHFLKEKSSGFFKTVKATDGEDTFRKGMKVGVVMVKDGGDIVDTVVVLKEAVILSDLKDIPRAMALLMGLLYSLKTIQKN
ncbi:uncharacterized protein LOC141793923 [Halichoeres trimaculatus]|uniref:uncharacterized protein LOC141793923 n=1 Tax=Halichoeres trimaculatus TaxID=147232 RepID=UPI003D9E67EE